MLERSLPSSEEAERVILGLILLDNGKIAAAIEGLKPDDLYIPFHRRVFSAMIKLFERQSAITPVLILEEMRRDGGTDAPGGVTTITNLTYGVPHYGEIDEFVKVVKDKSVLRQLIRTCNSIVSEALEQELEADLVLDNAEQSIFRLAETRANEGFATIPDIATRIMARIEQYRENPRRGITGLTTGFVALDDLTSGFQRSDLIIVAGRPSMGKTAFCLTLAQNAALKAGAVVAIFSLEMSKDQLVARMLASEARIDSARFRNGHIFQSELPRLSGAIQSLSEAKIFIDDTASISPLEIRAKARRLYAEQKQLDLIVIDYLQLMGNAGRFESRQQEVSKISRELKAIARELDVPVVALSQLSRAPESRNPPRPMMSDLRESGSIEQDADVVAFIYRDDYYNREGAEEGVAEILVAKQRNGPTGDIRLAFLKEFTRFENLISQNDHERVH
ncbi:MAG: replicative DNA helicase [Acidobacteria bacterium]|nr:replicative DNA helicase [Acidobacteriota bacterium]